MLKALKEKMRSLGVASQEQFEEIVLQSYARLNQDEQQNIEGFVDVQTSPEGGFEGAGRIEFVWLII